MNESTRDNLVKNPDFSGSKDKPEGWVFMTPRNELAPARSVKVKNDERSLVLSSNGDMYSFGCWCGEVNLKAGEWYRATVRVRIKDVDNPHLSLFAQVARHYLLPVGKWAEETLMEQVFRYSNESDGNKIELFFRNAQKGSVEWFAPCVERIEQPEHRIVRIASARFGNGFPYEELTIEEQQNRIINKLELAGNLKPDLVLMPEFTPIIGVPRYNFGGYFEVSEPVPYGPVCSILTQAALKFNMYVVAGIIERRGNYIFNTAVVFDRNGRFIGQYDKTHLTFDEMKEGISCGSDYPVFNLDFGKIAIHICYDEWFPEVSRHYAHSGAEILLLPVAGGKPITWRTRALDNGLYFVSSSINPPSMIIDSSGKIIAEVHEDGIAFAQLNLDYRKVNWYQDPTLSYGMPCVIPQMRNTLNDKLLEELPGLMKVDNC